jgi:hypothetical protein
VRAGVGVWGKSSCGNEGPRFGDDDLEELVVAPVLAATRADASLVKLDPLIELFLEVEPPRTAESEVGFVVLSFGGARGAGDAVIHDLIGWR